MFYIIQYMHTLIYQGKTWVLDLKNHINGYTAGFSKVCSKEH